MLGLDAHADEAGGEISEAREANDHAEQQRRCEGAGVVEDVIEHFVGEDLDRLGFADGGFAVVLNGAEILDC